MTDWDTRYDRDGYLFGTEPARFLTAHRGLIPDGARTLCVADGEGRNAVWLAQQGCRVTAFDLSDVALRKAGKLAEDRSVEVDFRQADITRYDWQAERYDLVVAIFFQFLTPAQRGPVFDGLKAALAPGGRLMLHGYTPEQVEFGTGGPPHAENMYTEALLAEAFGDLRILRHAAYEAVIEEGEGHAGRSALIDLIAERV